MVRPVNEESAGGGRAQNPGLGGSGAAERWRALDAFAEYLRAGEASGYTIRNYTYEVGHFLEFAEREGASGWEGLTRALTRRYLGELHAAGIARRSVARRISELRAFGKYLQRFDITLTNLFAHLRPPKAQHLLPGVLTRDEVEALLALPDVEKPAGMRDRAILEVLYGGGLRVAELVGLDLRDYRRAERTVVVVGKGNKQRVALLGRVACGWVDRYIAAARPTLAAAGEASEALFLNLRGGRLTARSVQRMLARLTTILDVDATPHTLRHSYATHMYATGKINLRELQELLGHASVNTTEIYTHLSPEQVRTAYMGAHPRAYLDAGASGNDAEGEADEA